VQYLTTPEVDMAERLRGNACSGTFEAHVTVEAADLDERERFRGVCGELGVKCVLIELPEGATRSQPMTASYHRGELEQVLREVSGITRGVREAGFPVKRLKLEAVATNRGVPDSDDDVRRFPPGNYFEFHVKVLLAAGADLGALRELCARHDARLSSNAYKQDSGGRSERFVTLRLYGVGRRSAFAACDRLLAELKEAGHALGNNLREYTIYDSAVSLDAGWIDAPG
jgi:hypothetical protein